MFEKYTLYNAVLHKKDGAEREEFLSAVSGFEQKGYKKVLENSFGGAEFCTLTNDKETVNITFKAKSGTLRIITEDGVSLPPEKSDSKEVCDTLVTQMQTCFFGEDCGMGYIIRMGDGTFAVIDGGMGYYDEPEHFIDLLNQQNINGGAPVIKAWFITHPHGDHYGLFNVMFNRFGDTFTVENVIFNWPSPEFAQGESESVAEFNRIVSELENVNVITARTGYKFSFCGNEFDILFSPEDTVPEKFGNVNDASIIMRHKVNGRTILWLGDIMTPGSDILMSEYDDELFKAEILQVAHHGFWGGSNKLYQTIDPQTLLWPLPDYHYYNMSLLEWNDHLVHSDRIKDVFYSSLEEATLNMSEPVKADHPYGNDLPEIIHRAEFSKKSMLSLGWSCIKGAKIRFVPAKAAFTEEGVQIKTRPETAALVEMVKAPFMEDAEKYMVHIKGEIECADEFGFVYNYANPKEIEDSDIIDLVPEKGRFEYTITADEKAKTLSVLRNGKELCNAEYNPSFRHGIAFCIGNADITFTKVEVKRI